MILKITKIYKKQDKFIMDQEKVSPQFSLIQHMFYDILGKRDPAPTKVLCIVKYIGVADSNIISKHHLLYSLENAKRYK